MRILHIITSLRIGGAEKLVVDLLPRLQKAGDRVSLLLFDGTKTPLYQDLERMGVPIVSLSIGWRAMRNPLLLFKLIRFLRKEPFDIVHSHNTSCQLMAAVSSLFVPLALVTTEHNTTNKRRTRKVYKPIDRWMYNRYRRIICVGKETEKALLNYLPNLTDKTAIITNGIDLRRFYEALPSKDFSNATGYKILMVAAFRAQKDHATLIRAFGLLPNTYYLFFAGGAETPDDEKNLQTCKNLVLAMHLDDRISFLGIRNDVPELLAACDVTVLSSHYEGLSLSAVECMASGKPLITSDVNGLRDLGGGACPLFPPGDSEKLAGLIRQVCENPDLAHEIGERCRKRAKLFDITETARRYREEYLRIITCTN